MRITFFELPKEWLRRPGRLEGRLERLYGRGRERERRAFPGDRMLWMCREVQAALGRRPQPPGAGWAGWLLRRQGLCQRLTLLLPDCGRENGWEELEAECRLAEEILEDSYEGLNGLLLISRALEGWRGSVELRENFPYFQHIYEETGLLTICTGEPAAGNGVWNGSGKGERTEEALGGSGRRGRGRWNPPPASLRAHICVDLRPGVRPPFRALPEGTLYLDLTSEEEKQRLLAARRKDISYVSGRICLDTYVRKRYNTTRYKPGCNADNG